MEFHSCAASSERARLGRLRNREPTSAFPRLARGEILNIAAVGINRQVGTWQVPTCRIVGNLGTGPNFTGYPFLPGTGQFCVLFATGSE
jgi:hypothetical protein